jgi:Fe-S-cluster containining protein
LKRDFPPVPAKGVADAFRRRLEIWLPSRDAGRALTATALREGIRLRPVITAAADAAAYADEAIGIVRQEYSPALDCKEGCWYCCCHPGILASIPELLRIVDVVTHTFPADALAALRVRAREYNQRQAARDGRSADGRPLPCPLLVNARCSVYEARPLTCRGYNSTDVDACRKNYENRSSTVPLYGLVRDPADGALVGSVQALGALGLNDTLVDLGRALDVGLNETADLVETLLRRRTSVLRPMENRRWASDLWKLIKQWASRLGVET